MDIRPLLLFNERVDRLDRSALANRMADPQYRLDYKRMSNREWISVDSVTEDDVDAFALNIRLLIQDRDGISIRHLAQKVYSAPAVPVDLCRQFDEHRQRWRAHSEKPSLIKHLTENGNFTNGELFEILLYGGIVHADPEKCGMFYALTRQGAFSTFVFVSFLESLRLFLDVVRSIRVVNLAMLEHIDWQRQHSAAEGTR